MEDSAVMKKGIPGSTLKMIAITTMFIDHIGAVIFERILAVKGLYWLNTSDIEAFSSFMEKNGLIYILDTVFRLIGRLGFPIFCFLLIEGFLHTRNVWKYAFRLFLFSLISEIPFDLAFRGELFNTGYQNVFFTLLLGLLALIFIQMAEKKLPGKKVLQYLFVIPVTVVFMLIAGMFIKCDYGSMGVLTIVVMYLFHKQRVWEMAGGCVVLSCMSLSEITAFFAIIPVYKYNGERGLRLKYIFYAFYPVHLLILYLITYFWVLRMYLKGCFFNYKNCFWSLAYEKIKSSSI